MQFNGNVNPSLNVPPIPPALKELRELTNKRNAIDEKIFKLNDDMRKGLSAADTASTRDNLLKSCQTLNTDIILKGLSFAQIALARLNMCKDDKGQISEGERYLFDYVREDLEQLNKELSWMDNNNPKVDMIDKNWQRKEFFHLVDELNKLQNNLFVPTPMKEAPLDVVVKIHTEVPKNQSPSSATLKSNRTQSHKIALKALQNASTIIAYLRESPKKTHELVLEAEEELKKAQNALQDKGIDPGWKKAHDATILTLAEELHKIKSLAKGS